MLSSTEKAALQELFLNEERNHGDDQGISREIIFAEEESVNAKLHLSTCGEGWGEG